MARRGENIYKRKDGRWEGRYIKGRKINGQIKYGYVYHQKYRIVKQRLIHYKALYQQEQPVDFYEGNVRNWLEHWLYSEVRNRVKESTFASYDYKIHQYILPYIGEEPLQKLTDETIQHWIGQLLSKGLSSATIRLVIQLFRMAIKHAKKKYLIWKDPTENVFVPKIKKRKVHALSLKEQRNLEKEALKAPEGASVLIALYTGLRIGEISALKWSDIDFSKQVIHVQRTTQRIPLRKEKSRTQLITNESKTESSNRLVPFSSHLKSYLLARKKRSKSEFVSAIKEKALEPRGITYHFRKLLKKINLGYLHFHQLRHTFATRALEVGGDIASISALLGHHSAKFTLEFYLDSLFHQRKKITKKIEKKYFLSILM